MSNPSPESAALVLELLDYIEQVEKLKTKPAFSIPGDSPFVACQPQLRGLPELQFNLQSEGDDLWLRMPRLQEIPAPEPDAELKPWIDLIKTPEKTPEIKREIITDDGTHKSIDAHPETKTLFDWYVAN